MSLNLACPNTEPRRGPVSRVLVTGATGFVGKRLVARLLANGADEVRCLVRSAERVAMLPDDPRMTSRLGDLTAPETLAGIAEGCDTVIHLAAEGHVSAQSEEALRRFTAVNVDGTAALVREAARAGSVERFVHFSSTAAMGLVERPIVDEDDEPQPRTPYQRSKCESERAALAAGRETGVAVVVLRPCMIFGIGAIGEFGKMARLMRLGRFPKVGHGANLTPLVHVDDVVQAALKAAACSESFETYLVTAERSASMDELRGWIMEGWGETARYPYVPVGVMYAGAWVFELLGKVTGRPPLASRRNIANTVYDRVFSIDKARRDLGYEPGTDLHSAAVETVRWLKEQER